MARSELDIIIGLTDKTKGPLSGLTGSLKKVGKVAMGVALGGVAALGTGIFLVARKAIPAASDLVESINAVNVVFEDNADTILEWGKTAADTAGLSQAEFAQMAAQTGAMLQNFGLDAETAADQTINLAQRAADMASIFNTDVDQALTAIQAGLRGEADPLEKFGVSLSAAAVKAKALSLGLEDAEGQLTNTALTTARLALLFEQTDKIAGDFVNTSGDLANASRVQAARWENFMARIGSFMLPIIQKFQSVFMDIAEKVMPLVENALADVMPGIERFADLIGQLIQVIMEMGLLSSETREVLTDMFGADVAASIMNFVESFIAVKDAVMEFVNGVLIPFIRDHGAQMVKILGFIVAGFAAFSIISSVIGFITGLIATIAALSAAFAAAGGGIAGIIAIIGGPLTLIILAIIGVVALLTAAWKNNWGDIQGKTKAVIAFIRNLIQGALDWIRNFWDQHGEQIMAIVQTIWDTVVGIFQWFVDYVTIIFEAFSAAFSGDWETFGAKIREAWDKVWEAIKTILSAAWKFISTAVFEGIANIIKWFQETDWKQVGIDILKGIANGISAGARWALDAIMAVARSILGALKGFFDFGSPARLMVDFGQDLMKGMALGISDASQLPTMAAVKAGEGVMSAISGTLPDLMRGLSALRTPEFRFSRPEFAYATPPAGGGSRSQSLTLYGDMNFPNVTDRASFLEEISELMT